MRKCFLLSLSFLLAASRPFAQLVINGGTITLGAGATITVQGDLTSNADILGTGKIIMGGTTATAQQMNMNGFIIPNLEINSVGNVVMGGNAKISTGLSFVAGKIQTGNNNLVLASTAAVTGAGAATFVETNGTGQVQKEITTAGNYDLPVGTGTNYMPLQYQVSGGTIAPGALVGTRVIAGAHPAKPIRSTDYITGYWKPAYSGITGATINAVGTYSDGSLAAGTDETVLNGLKYDGTDWSLSSPVNTGANTATFNTVATGSELYAMNKFVFTNAKIFLQGAYNGSTMNDNLRAGGLIPLSDPYRTAPYSTTFTHTNNAVAEVASAAVFADFGTNNNIVDWVFVELRSSTGALTQTRSALVQKDGDIVDVDGINPLYFKNLDPANYVITVRHRNHLGLSADITNYSKALSVAKPTAANIFDFTAATDAQIFGDAAAFTTSGAVKLLWAGNANSNGFSRYSGPSNDHNYLLSTELGGNGSTVLTSVYRGGDLNMNGTVRYSGPGTDHGFLLTNVLGGNGSTVISQQIITP